jgi:hypothetical protein
LSSRPKILLSLNRLRYYHHLPLSFPTTQLT